MDGSGKLSSKEKTMRNKIRNTTSLILVFGLFLSLILGCGGGKPVSPKYQGDWIGEDGTTLYIDHTWKIDQEPNERGEMRLDGKIYRRR
jgi:hypothetical protein